MFSDIFLFYFRQMLKSPFYVGSMLFMIIMLIIRFLININEEFDYMNYGSFTGEMMLIVQAMMLLFMIFFYKLFSDEFRFGVGNLFVGTFRVTLLKIAAILCNHLLFLFVFISVQLVFIYMYFFFSGIPLSSFYIQTASYVFVYWYLPFVFALLLGTLTALVFGKNKTSFVFILICWFAIGPVNTELFSQYFRQIPPSDARVIFYISPLINYKELVGYDLSISSYLKIIFWIFLSLALIFLVLIKSTRTIREKSMIFIGVVCLISINALLLPQITKYTEPIFSYAAMNKEDSYYEDYEQEVLVGNLQYSIEQYDIQLKNTDQTHAKTTVTLSNVQSNQLTFTLYHQFAVEKITSKENGPLKFTQEGDFVLVEWASGAEQAELTFEYIMQDSAKIPVSEDYLFLPNYLSWVPVKSSHPQYKHYDIFGGDIFTLSTQTKKDIEYNLIYEGGLPIYTNVEQIGENSYSEQVSGGISVIGGMTARKNFDDRVVVYPNSWSDISDDWPAYESVLIDVHNVLVDMFDITDVELPNEIILLSPNLGSNAYISSDHLLINHGTMLNISSAVGDIPEIYLQALLWNYDNREIDEYEQIMAFNRLLAAYIKAYLDFDAPGYAPFAETRPAFLPNEESINTFYEEYHRLENERQRDFLILWYKEMHHVSDSWQKALELLYDFRGEES
ncbi:ABC transporter permease [Lentibacillus sediminis]|uniref:ABC transporter permease n=1 Tax=Lentibacillus sediminis TaxID=1940529 RepID=UPI000C1C66CF|nr:ABC transporter permease [Lentibacillus sediminis]